MSIVVIIYLAAFVLTLLHKAPPQVELWVPVLLLCIGLLLQAFGVH